MRLKKLLNLFLSTGTLVVTIGCQPTFAPTSSTLQSGDALPSSSLAALSCSGSNESVDLYDLGDEKVAFCDVFSETTADLLIVQLVSQDCDSICQDSIRTMHDSVEDSNFDSKVNYVIISQKVANNDLNQIQFDELASAIWLQDKDLKMESILAESGLSFGDNVMVLASPSKAVSVSTAPDYSLQDYLTTANTDLGLSIQTVPESDFQWNGLANRGSLSWDVQEQVEN